MPFVCENCHSKLREFRLSCPECGSWQTIIRCEAKPPDAECLPQPLPDVAILPVSLLKTNMEAFDVLLGGGFLPGSTVLLSGPPGAGKSTLLLQLMESACASSLYVTGEESIQLVKLRANRLNVNARTIAVLYETEVNKIASHIGKTPLKLVVIDSIQTVHTADSQAVPGTPAQIRKCISLLRHSVQERNVVLVLVGQITKAKQSAGPKLLEHAVDVVMYLDFGPAGKQDRVLRVVKNRFGPSSTSLSLCISESGFRFPGENT